MKNNINGDYDLIIIGAGPGGLTSAIYATRAELQVLIIESGPPGGKMVKTYDIENYPGFENILGPDLSIKIDEQAKKLGVKYEYSQVLKITKENDDKLIYCENGTIWKTNAVIIATGTIERQLGVSGEKELYGRGVSYCAVCDGAFFRDKNIVVVGGGNAAIEEAIYLTKFAKTLFLVHRRQGFRADHKVIEIAKKNSKIVWELDFIVKEIKGDDKVSSVIIEHVKTKQQKEIVVEAIFPYIGSDPITSFIQDLNITDKNGYIITDEKMQTAIKGIFAVGDVRVTPLRQIATAVGDGAIAAQMAVRYLDELKQ